ATVRQAYAQSINDISDQLAKLTAQARAALSPFESSPSAKASGYLHEPIDAPPPSEYHLADSFKAMVEAIAENRRSTEALWHAEDKFLIDLAFDLADKVSFLFFFKFLHIECILFLFSVTTRQTTWEHKMCFLEIS
ncbi:MAG TPA: hypothetical protein VGO47_02230, partial [Chlamydiales bacterium]|nr:hypothetical protein [Chlamydiales bacterium]